MNLQTKKIVWIEDDSPIIASVVKPLERDGYAIQRLRTVDEALNNLELLRASDLILLDIFLPPGGHVGDYGRYAGLQLLRELRRQHDVRTPVIVLSVLTNSNVYTELLELDVAEIVRKPVLPSKLKQIVERILDTAS